MAPMSGDRTGPSGVAPRDVAPGAGCGRDSPCPCWRRWVLQRFDRDRERAGCLLCRALAYGLARLAMSPGAGDLPAFPPPDRGPGRRCRVLRNKLLFLENRYRTSSSARIAATVWRKRNGSPPRRLAFLPSQARTEAPNVQTQGHIAEHRRTGPRDGRPSGATASEPATTAGPAPPNERREEAGRSRSPDCARVRAGGAAAVGMEATSGRHCF